MRRPVFLAALLASITACVLIGTKPLTAQDTPGCRVVPADGRIQRAGRYCLTEDLITDRRVGIEVDADDVVIDLGGHAIRADADMAGSIGVSAADRMNLSIGNGALAGWYEGVSLSNIDGLRVESLAVDDILFLGLRIGGSRDIVIRDNVLRGFRYDRQIEAAPYLIGIHVSARNCAIVGNDISNAPPGTANTIETVHILLPAESGTDCFLGSNHLWSEAPSAKSYGVWVGLENQATIVGNRLENQQYALAIDGDAEVVAVENRFEMAPEARMSQALKDTSAVYAPNARTLLLNNEIRNYSNPLVSGDHTHDAGTIIH